MRTDLDDVLDLPNVQAWLRLIRWCEGTAGPDGYRTMFGGGLIEDFEDHPRRAITRKLGGKPITSTAAGAYQFLEGTWDECVKALDLPDFSPGSQDVAALYLTKRRRALSDVIGGRWGTAIELCNKEWASLPGSPYGQPTKKLADCLTYISNTLASLQEGAGEAIAPSPTIHIPKEVQMPLPAVAAAALQILTPLLTSKIQKEVAKHTDSETGEATAAQVVRIAQEVSGQADPIDAAVSVRGSEALAGKFQEGVEHAMPLLERIAELDAKSTAAARDFALRSSESPAQRMPALWVTAALVPLAYVTVWKVLSGDFTPEIKGAVIMAVVVATLADVRQFWLGSSHGSQVKDWLKR